MKFRHETVDEEAPSREFVFCHTADITGNGRPDVIVGAKGDYDNLRVFGLGTRFPNYPRVLREKVGLARGTIFWYENPGWERHRISETRRLEVGSAVGDVDGDGRIDLLVGQTVHHDGLFWYRQPEDPREPWTEHLVTDEFEMYHDLRYADIDDDGDPELVALSQESETIFYYDIPSDPTREPWPDDHRHVIDPDRRVEGAEVVDIDGDGRTELIAGTAIYRRPEDGGPWDRTPIVEGWDDTRIAVADLDDDGELEVILSEGDSPVHGTHPGRVAWFDPPEWEVHFLETDLFCPHSLAVADFTDDGRPDVYVGEMGLGEYENPRGFVFLNQGDGEFDRHVVSEGIPTHEAKVADLDGDGRPDVVGKPHAPGKHVDAWFNEG